MASVASTVVRDVLRIQENEPVIISAAEHTVDLATDVALECFKVGADPAIFYQNDAYFYGQFKYLTDDQLRNTSAHCLGLAEYARSYVGLSATKDPAQMAKIPNSKWAAYSQGEDAHHQKDLVKRPKSAFVGMSLVTRERAKTYGINYAAWKKNVEDAISVNYTAMAKIAQLVKGLFLVPHNVHITADNGTDLKFRLAGASRPVDVVDGIISDEDIASGTLGDVQTSLPSGSVTVAPIEDSANGTFVGDVGIPSVGRLIEGLTWTFRNGKVTDFTAKRNLASAQINYAEGTGAKDMFGSLTIGVNPKAKAGYLHNYIANGTVMIGIGDNRDYGGTNESNYGFGDALAHGTLKLDGKRIIEDGRIVV